MSNIKPCVVIPTHKSNFTDNELKSIYNTCSTLKKHDVYIIFPQKIQTEITKKLNGLKIIFKGYPNHYFNSMASYNVFLTMPHLYKDFYAEGYTHILITHTDSYVFKDDLEIWCNKNISYIGAPWFIRANNELQFIGSGNGGFSLRRINDFLSLLDQLLHKPKYEPIWFRAYLIIATIFSQNFMFFRYLIRPLVIGNIHEDTFWGVSAPKIVDTFIVGNEKQSTSFAFETYPEKLFKANNNELPFGCHGWENYNYEFWRKFIN